MTPPCALPGHTTSKKRKSSVLFGVGEDAAIVAQQIARNQSPHRTAPPSGPAFNLVFEARPSTRRC